MAGDDSALPNAFLTQYGIGRRILILGAVRADPLTHYIELGEGEAGGLALSKYSIVCKDSRLGARGRNGSRPLSPAQQV